MASPTQLIQLIQHGDQERVERGSHEHMEVW